MSRSCRPLPALSCASMATRAACRPSEREVADVADVQLLAGREIAQDEVGAARPLGGRAGAPARRRRTAARRPAPGRAAAGRLAPTLQRDPGRRFAGERKPPDLGYSFFSPVARFTTVTLDWTGRRCRRRRCASRVRIRRERGPLPVVGERERRPSGPPPRRRGRRRRRRPSGSRRSGTSSSCRRAHALDDDLRVALLPARAGSRTTGRRSTAPSRRGSSRR